MTKKNKHANTASQPVATNPASKKRKSDGPVDEPANKKQKSSNGSSSEPKFAAQLIRRPEFKAVLSALNQDGARQNVESLNAPLVRSKFGALIQAIKEIKSQQPGTKQSIALLAIILIGKEFNSNASKAIDAVIGRDRRVAWMQQARHYVDSASSTAALQPAAGNSLSAGPASQTAQPLRRSKRSSAQAHPTVQHQPQDAAMTSLANQSFTHPLDDGAGYGSEEAPSIGSRKSSLPSVGDANANDQEDGEIVSDTDSGSAGLKLFQVSEDEQQRQTRYYGLTDSNDLVYCSNCSKRGHLNTAESCPARSCSVCLTISHCDRNCPKQQKCLRCRRRGHRTEGCTSASVPAGGIGDECDLCGNLGHAEGECSYLWRAFIPEKGVKFRKIPASQMRVYCYACGAEGHWGGDCPTRPDDSRGVPSCFTAKHAAQFILSDELNGHGSNGYGAQYDEPARSGGMPAYQLRQLSDYV